MLGGIVDFFKNMGRRKVSVLMFRDDRTFDHLTLPVDDRYIVDEKNSRAWALRSSSLVPYKGKLCEIVCEHDCVPLSLDGGKEEWDIELNAIASEKYKAQKAKIEKESLKSKSWNFFLMIGLVLSLAFVAVIVSGLLKSGTLRFPSFGG